ncbi:DMT family transporter [Cochlodiniinecator piscidefendens]|uniref:DMT family transporter n=1 Tax=Cochlodiniinecator piscidefendens TaxID=2715756 RepID=UPI00140E33A0|nr:DMT family transporter [Cochlodiniinecator piscidefendens]
MTHDRPMLGLLLMTGFCVLAPLGDGMAKLLSETVSLGALLFVRFAAQAVFLGPVVWALKLNWRMPSHIFKLVVVRTILHIMGIGLMFSALRYLPLADAIAIAFVMPFIMLLLGRLVLNEEIGSRRLIACFVGFIGTLFVIQPSFTAVGYAALLPLGVALVFALFMLVTRQIAKVTDPIALQAVSGSLASLILLPALMFGQFNDIADLTLQIPNLTTAWLMLAIGAVGTIAHLLMTWSLRYAPSATLAPMQYLEIPFATIIGFALFGDFPNGLSALGIAITVAAGLYVIYREQAIARQIPSTQQ